MKTYVLYRNEEIVGIGTAAELATMLGVKPDTICWYATPTARKRKLGVVAVKVSDVEDQDGN